MKVPDQNGSVLKYEKKQVHTPADSQPQSQPQTQGTAAISVKQAQEIVLTQGSNSTMVELELDRDNGRMVYDGECRKGQMEYEFKLDAQIKAILEWEEDF
ncbi:MAG: PepSY domain-containing protein [Oscillospiraceae bacterium]